jgi:hypothetical protein
VFFESSDGVFSSVAEITVGRHQLILHIIGSDKMIQSGRCLVVESLEFWFETLDSEFLMDVVIGLDPFWGGSGFHRYDFDVVSVINITDHDVRVSLTGSHQEFSREVRVKLSLINQDGINKVGFCAQVCVSGWHVRDLCFRS